MSNICFPVAVDTEQRSLHVQSMDGAQRLRNSQISGNSHGPCLEAETTVGKANGHVVANKCQNQQEDEILEI